MYVLCNMWCKYIFLCSKELCIKLTALTVKLTTYVVKGLAFWIMPWIMGEARWLARRCFQFFFAPYFCLYKSVSLSQCSLLPIQDRTSPYTGSCRSMCLQFLHVWFVAIFYFPRAYYPHSVISWNISFSFNVRTLYLYPHVCVWRITQFEVMQRRVALVRYLIWV